MQGAPRKIVEVEPRPRTHPLAPGEPAPWFTCRTRTRDDYDFSSVAGRFIVLSFLGDAADKRTRTFLGTINANRAIFDGEKVAFFGVITNPERAQDELVQDAIPEIRFFLDYERSVSSSFGAIRPDGTVRPITYVLDWGLRVLVALDERVPDEGAALLDLLSRLPAFPPARVATMQAPVLVLPQIFEVGLCRRLISYYENLGGEESGFMREREGMTKGVIDYSFKRRLDRQIEDEELRRICSGRIRRRLAPEIRKAFQFNATRIERFIIACYDGRDGGFFRAHRDNTTRGTAHRRFAVSLFLNSDYHGGQLRFPEYGNALFSAPTGGAVIFSCSILHEALPVTSGKRYMFLPFLYDEASAKVRQTNEKFLDGTDIERVGESTMKRPAT